MKFTYRWAQRPLEGYTIKRGLGHGGFGEVYFALSDGGKEVALKLVRGHTETELRGIANCLNLKHPHLVHLYDLRKDSQGDYWLVMEYIHGEPLSSVLNHTPRGLPEAQARQWFLEAARAVAYLHDHGVVHRDIKPANIFIENGSVKLGDYGLSKSVAISQHNQSTNVGTIHYMAPEIAGGSYSKQVDVYACGVMLYEMLTGDVPFRGETWNEIAMRHQTDLPDLTKVPEPYRPILERALDKKATRRFNDLNEMIREVEAIGRAAPAIDALSRTQPSASVLPRPPEPPPTRVGLNGHSPTAPVTPAPGWRKKVSELAGSLALTPFAAVPVAGAWALYNQSLDWTKLGPLFLLIVLLTWAVVIACKTAEGTPRRHPSRWRMAWIGVFIGVAAFWLDGWTFPKVMLSGAADVPREESYLRGMIQAEPGTMRTLGGYVLYFALALGLLRWWHTADPRRNERFSLFPMLAAGFWGAILLMLGKWFPMLPGWVALTLIGAAGAIQLVSPWAPPPPKPRRLRRLVEMITAR